MLAAIGSTRTAASVVAVLARAPRRARRGRCTGTTIVSATVPSVTPAEPGSPNVATPLPACDEQRVEVAVVAARELHDLRRGRSRRARAAPRSSRLRCPTTRGAPSRPTAHVRRSPPASSTSRGVGAPNEVPSAAARCTASTIAGCGVAEDRRAPRLHVVEVLRCRRCPRGTRRRRAATKNGSPPTAPNARTGEFTPPGMRACARANQSRHAQSVRLSRATRRRRARST